VARTAGRSRRRDELDRLVATAKRFSATLDHATVLANIVDDATTLLDANSGDILLWERERGTLRVVAVSGLPDDLIGYEMAYGEGISSEAIVAGRPLQVDDYATYPNRARMLDQYVFGAVLCAPLLFRGDAIGAINVHISEPVRSFRAGDADLLQAFAGLAAIAIDHARRFESEVRLREELARTNADLLRSLSLQRQISGQVLAGGGPGAVADELARVLDRAVVIEDHLDRVLAGASPDGGVGWRQLAVTDAPTSLRTRPRTAGGATDPVRLPVMVGSEVVGRLTLGQVDAPGPSDRALADIAATGVALEFAKSRAASDVEQRIRGDVVADLLHGTYVSEDAIASRAARLGYNVDDLRDVLVVTVPTESDSDGSDSAGAALRLERRLLDRLTDLLGAIAPGSPVASIGHRIVVLATARRDPHLAAAPAFAAHLRQRLKDIVEGRPLAIALVDGRHGPHELGAGYELARASLDLMSRLGRADGVIDARALGPYRVLLTATDPQELRDFARRTLEPVLEHDRRSGGELLATLRAYLAEGGNRRRTASALFVHVNTVVYRLERIERALGRRLDDPDVRFDLMLATRILDIASDAMGVSPDRPP